MAELRVSELPTAASLDDSDLLLLSQVDANSQTGYASAKTTNVALATKVAKQTNFSDLQTTSKNIIGAINEVSGAASSLVDLDDVDITTPADGECLQYDGTSQKWENKDILAVNETTLTEPYVYKQVPNGKYTEKLKKIIGASVVWNQLIENNIKSGSVIPDNTGRSSTQVFSSSAFRCIANHIYIVSVKFTSNGTKKLRTYCGSGGVYGFPGIDIKHETKYAQWFFKPSASGAIFIGLSNQTTSDNLTSDDSWYYDDVCVTDLTVMLGSEIAEYANTLERTNIGSGFALLNNIGLFSKNNYGYSANTIQSVSVSAHVTKDSNDQPLTTTTLDHTTLRGLFKLDANNNLYADGDVYNADGSGSVKYAEIDMGDMAWTYSSSGYFYSYISDKANGNYNLLCSKYLTTSADSVTNMGDKEIKGHASNFNIYIKDSAYTNATTFTTAVTGQKIIYELATPTTATLTPFNPLSTIEQGGTEEFIDYGVEQSTRDVAIPCGNESVYGDNRLMAQIIKYINN